MEGKEIAQLGLVLYEEDIYQFHSKYVFFCHRYTQMISRSCLSGGASVRKGSNSKDRDVEIWAIHSYPLCCRLDPL